MTTMDRRRFIGITAGMACLGGAEFVAAEEAKPYVRANTDWLAKCRYGIGVHWTAQTVPRNGPPLPFQKAVDAFDVKRFVDQLAYAGADYLLFTSTHALQMLPAPHPVIDRILPGRTCKRDLIAELADALAAKGMPLLVYYNHSCNSKDDPPWEQAVGYHDRDKNRLAQNLLDIVGWMGERYKDKIKAWWFDSPYSLDLRGPHNSVTTDMTGFQFPWERFTVAAKLGYPARLVTYNAGVNETFLYTTHQDYWAGELVDLKHPPQGRYLCQRTPVVRLDVPGGPGLGASPAGHGDSQAALLRRGGRLLRPHLQSPPGPDDLQRRHLPGRDDGRSLRGAASSAEKGAVKVRDPARESSGSRWIVTAAAWRPSPPIPGTPMGMGPSGVDSWSGDGILLGLMDAMPGVGKAMPGVWVACPVNATCVDGAHLHQLRTPVDSQHRRTLQRKV